MNIKLLLLSSAFILPLVSVLIQGIFVPLNTIEHVLPNALIRYLTGTVSLVALVIPCVFILGTVTGWLQVHCVFPGRKFMSWGLMLPFAFPTYLLAYVYIDCFQESWPEIRSMPVAAGVFSVGLYPYVYLMARSSFQEQSTQFVAAARMLGRSPWQAVIQIALPLVRPSLIAGVAIAMMEVVADFGTIEFFALDGLSTGVYRTWFALGDKAGAARISIALLIVAFLLMSVERFAMRKSRYFGSGQRSAQIQPVNLLGFKRWMAAGVVFIPIALGFVFPFCYLGLKVINGGWQHINVQFVAMAGRSFALAASAAAICCAFGMALVWISRKKKGLMSQALVLVSSLGYAMPGAVLAVSLVFPVAWIDGLLADAVLAVTGYEIGLILSGTTIALIYAYTVRFGAIPLQSFQSALQRLTPSMESSSYVLGHTSKQTFFRIILPLTRPSLIAAFVLVFVDTIKELTSTLMLRPMNFNTLAVYTYHLASDERLLEASPAALLIVVVGIAPVYLVHRLAKDQ